MGGNKHGNNQLVAVTKIVVSTMMDNNVTGFFVKKEGNKEVWATVTNAIAGRKKFLP